MVENARPRLVDPQTSARLARQKQHSTGPELAVRRIVCRLGHRYRVNNRDLPGSPDLVNRSKKWAMFVHGCFWHAHPGCPKASIPKSNRKFWIDKFMANRERDNRKIAELQALGFDVIVVWECELKDADALRRKLKRDIPQI